LTDNQLAFLFNTLLRGEIIMKLTACAATYGNSVANGAKIAVAEINAMGGLQFELNFQDDEHDAE
jgi:ABC-type branched-subunit amino acid transport system substrate-binding protein